MQLDVMIVTPLNENCYLLHDGNEGVMFDPGGDFNLIKEYLDETGIKVKLILNTHGHFDHIGAVTELKEFSGAEFWMHEDDMELLPQGAASAVNFGVQDFVVPTVDKYITDGQVVNFKGTDIHVLHTPGHSRGSVCFYIPSESLLISGDTLFFESVGRSDFPTSNPRDIVRSIKDKIYTLPDETVVCPGHACSTKVGYEKQFNPFVKPD